MRFLAAIAACALAMLALGCAQASQPAPSRQAAGGGAAEFVLPALNVSYHAVYAVEEGGEMQKEVWRAPGSMRADLSVQGKKALSFYFVGSRAYSCSFLSGGAACYDVTPTLSQADVGRLVPVEGDYAKSARVEGVNIGGTDGRCYESDVIGIGARKVCFAVGGVAAYDAYNVSKSVQHTEYLTSLDIYPAGQGIDASVFALPAKPEAAPSAAMPYGE